MDPNFGAKGNVLADGRSIQEMMRAPEIGYYFDTNVNDSHADGHQAVANRLRWDGYLDGSVPDTFNRPSFFIMPGLQNHIWSLSNYQKSKSETMGWQALEKKKPDGPAKDFCDLVRYAAVKGFVYRSWQTGKNTFRKYNDQLVEKWAVARGAR
jgi:hypothetical protein